MRSRTHLTVTSSLRRPVGTSIGLNNTVITANIHVVYNICSLIVTASELVLGDSIPLVNQIKIDGDDDDDDDIDIR